MANPQMVIEGINALNLLESALTDYLSGLGWTVELNVSNGTTKNNRNPKENGLSSIICAKDQVRKYEHNHWVKKETKGSETVYLLPPSGRDKVEAGDGFMVAIDVDGTYGGNLMVPVVLSRMWANAATFWAEKSNVTVPEKVKDHFNRPIPFYPWVILGAVTWGNTIPLQTFYISPEPYIDNGQSNKALNEILKKAWNAILNNKSQDTSKTIEEETLSLSAPMMSVLGEKAPSYKVLGFTGIEADGVECFIDDNGEPVLPFWSINTVKPEGNVLRVDANFYNAAVEG